MFENLYYIERLIEFKEKEISGLSKDAWMYSKPTDMLSKKLDKVKNNCCVQCC